MNPQAEKYRLDAMLERVLELEAYDDDAYHAIISQANQVRRAYGLSADVQSTRGPVVHTPRDQLISAGAENNQRYAEMVARRCLGPEVALNLRDNAGSLFDKAFGNPVHASDFKMRAVTTCKRKSMRVGQLTVLPPLLCRSRNNESVRFVVGTMGALRHISGPVAHADLIIIMFKEGPVIPIVHESRVCSLPIARIYAVDGEVSAASLAARIQ